MVKIASLTTLLSPELKAVQDGINIILQAVKGPCRLNLHYRTAKEYTYGGSAMVGLRGAVTVYASRKNAPAFLKGQHIH